MPALLHLGDLGSSRITQLSNKKQRHSMKIISRSPSKIGMLVLAGPAPLVLSASQHKA